MQGNVIRVPIGNVVLAGDLCRNLVGDIATGFSVGGEAHSPSWTEMDEEIVFKSDRFALGSLRGSWEGEGGLTVREADHLRLIFHFDDSEEFTSAAISGAVITAESGGYPLRRLWHISLDDPITISVSAIDPLKPG